MITSGVPTVVGVIADTHGLARPQALDALAEIAPVTPGMAERDGVLYFNPGSAGPRRFRLPVCVGRWTVRGTREAGEIIELSV